MYEYAVHKNILEDNKCQNIWENIGPKWLYNQVPESSVVFFLVLALGHILMPCAFCSVTDFLNVLVYPSFLMSRS